MIPDAASSILKFSGIFSTVFKQASNSVLRISVELGFNVDI